ncbi:MAG: 50S ribosomal protein L11 methyltransferase [Allosphingosinicella sp.]
MAEVSLGRGLVSTAGAFARIGRALVGSGEGLKALALARAALEAHPDNAELRQAVRLVLSHNIPGWHAAMLADDDRNTAFESAIRRAVDAGTRVLDIGTGSGLLAMMAARAGARDVVACESNPLVAETAREIVAANGYGDTIRVIGRPSTELSRDDVGGAIDVVIAEIFSDDLLVEGALATFRHARNELARPGARFLPARASVRAALAWRDPSDRALPSQVSGFDLSAFERHVVPYRRLQVDDRKLFLRSEPVDLFRFDFAAGAADRGRTELSLTPSGGAANGVVQWLRLELDDELAYENRPAAGTHSHWGVYFHPAMETLPEGVPVTVHGAHDADRLQIWL